MKKILFSADAREKIKKGIDKCVDVVKVSLGGHGRNVLIFNGQTTEIINDGVSIAREVNVRDEVEQAGIQLAKQCAAKTDEEAGDGTTTTLVLLQSILNESMSEFQTENPRKVREELFEEAQEVLDRVVVKKIEKKEDLYNLALTSSLDEKIAKVVSEVYWEVGKDGKITVESVSKDVIEGEVVKGMQLETRKADIIKDEQKKMLDGVDVLVTDVVEDKDQIQTKVTDVVSRGGNNLVVIANKFSRAMLLSFEKTTGFNIYPLEYKNLRSMDDLRAYVGDKPVDKVIIDNEETYIIGGKGEITARIETLREMLEKEQSAYMKEDLQRRIAELSSGVGVIRVGKKTEVESNEYALKVEDAIGAIKGAFEEGYVKGCGLALKLAAQESSSRMKAICESPYEQICKNAGVENIEASEKIIDSYKSVKNSLLNALSTATSITTVEAALIKEKDDD